MADTTFCLVLTVSVNENQAEQLRQAGYGKEAQHPSWYVGYVEGAGDYLLPGVTVTSAAVATDGDAVRSLHEGNDPRD